MNGRTASQIYISGVMSRHNSNYVHIRELVTHNIDLAELGIEPNIVGDDNEDSVINLSRPSLELSAENYNQLLTGLQQVVPDVTACCHDHGISFYMITLVFVNDFIRSLS
jgi:gentisate 1,2-dioxygenase